MNKINRCLNIINFILWSILLIASIFSPNSVDLRFTCIASTFIVVLDLFSDLLSEKKETIKKEALVKSMQEFINEVKQGDK